MIPLKPAASTSDPTVNNPALATLYSWFWSCPFTKENCFLGNLSSSTPGLKCQHQLQGLGWTLLLPQFNVAVDQGPRKQSEKRVHFSTWLVFNTHIWGFPIRGEDCSEDGIRMIQEVSVTTTWYFREVKDGIYQQTGNGSCILRICLIHLHILPTPAPRQEHGRRWINLFIVVSGLDREWANMQGQALWVRTRDFLETLTVEDLTWELNFCLTFYKLWPRPLYKFWGQVKDKR